MTKNILTFLGTGTSQGIPVIGCPCSVCQSDNPRDKRLRTSAMLTISDKNYVLDVGPDFRQQLLREKVTDVEAILITHEHNDHIMGLDDVRPINFQQLKNVPVFATEQVQADLRQRFAYVFAENPYPGAPQVELHTIKNDENFRINDVEFTPIEVLHGNLPVLGFRVNNLTYLTDVKTISEAAFEKMKGTKTLIISALHRNEHHSHLTLLQALEIIKKINPERTYLVHLSHQMGLHEEVSKELPNNVAIAYDGLKVEF